jgi:hypothetical protein
MVGSAWVKNSPIAWEVPLTDTVLSAYTGDLTQMLSTLSGMSARPSFNLAFANMQNAMANRYNDEMATLQQKALDSYDTSLDSELSKLKEQLPKLVEYQSSVANTRNLLLDRLDDLSDLDTINSTLQLDASKGNPVTSSVYDAGVKNVNDKLGRLPFLEGSEFGFFGDDGVGNMRLKGVGLADFSVDMDNATPPTGSSYDLVKARTKINDAVELVTNRLDMVAGEVERIADRITEIQEHQQAKVADIKADIAKQAEQKKLQIAMQLQALSVSFESQQASNEKIVKAQANDTYTPGSVVNLFS